MNFPVFLNKWIIGFKPIKYTPVWYWFRLINHDGWRMDDHQRYWDFWLNLNDGWDHMNYVHKFEEYWGKGSWPPEKIVLPAKDFDALVEKLNEPPKYNENLAKLLQRKSPWEEEE
jgi:hypothetical protein